MNDSATSLLPWLMEGDISVRYQTSRDLLLSPTAEQNKLRSRIALEGWGKRLLNEWDPKTGLWGGGLYSPKWVSTHYTLLELKNLCLPPETQAYQKGASGLLGGFWPEGGLVHKDRYQDLCVSAMLLSICCYAGIRSEKIDEIVDYILLRQYPDGGYNCRWQKGDMHSSLHTTLSVLEAFHDYVMGGYNYRLAEMRSQIPAAQEFILQKHLFRSVNTGEIIDPNMLMLSYPCRWKYDILRCLDAFAAAGHPYDKRMDEALDLLLIKKRKNNRWPVQHKHAGKVYFNPEVTGSDSRMNTLRVLRVFKAYNTGLYAKLTQLS